MALQAERTLHQLFKRCLLCPSESPSCPSCPGNQICSLVPQSCDACAQMICIANPSGSPSSPGPNVGAIAGGVIGGVVFILVVVTLLWRFWIKKKRAQQDWEAEQWEEDDIAQAKSGSRFNNMRSDAASTRTRASLAHSFLSRASNIIHIAYFPGVTNRSESGHNSLLNNVPVPPIPAAYANSAQKSPLSNQGDALFFRPGDLRDSTYSSTSSLRSGHRDTQYTMNSITPSLARSSMASEIYHDDGTIEPMPATTITRVLPRMVSVKSSQASSPSDSIGSSKQVHSSLSPNTALYAPRSLSGGSITKATQINIKNKGRIPIRLPSDASSAASARYLPILSTPLTETSGESDTDDDYHRRGLASLLNGSGSPNTTAASTPVMQPVEVDNNPFFDASELPLSDTPPPAPLISTAPVVAPRPNPYAAMSSSVGTSLDPRVRRPGDRSVGGLSAVIEEATKRASRGPNYDGAGARHDLSPFSDAYAAP